MPSSGLFSEGIVAPASNNMDHHNADNDSMDARERRMEDRRTQFMAVGGAAGGSKRRGGQRGGERGSVRDNIRRDILGQIGADRRKQIQNLRNGAFGSGPGGAQDKNPARDTDVDSMSVGLSCGSSRSSLGTDVAGAKTQDESGKGTKQQPSASSSSSLQFTAPSQFTATPSSQFTATPNSQFPTSNSFPTQFGTVSNCQFTAAKSQFCASQFTSNPFATGNSSFGGSGSSSALFGKQTGGKESGGGSAVFRLAGGATTTGTTTETTTPTQLNGNGISNLLTESLNDSDLNKHLNEGETSARAGNLSRAQEDGRRKSGNVVPVIHNPNGTVDEVDDDSPLDQSHPISAVGGYSFAAGSSSATTDSAGKRNLDENGERPLTLAELEKEFKTRLMQEDPEFWRGLTPEEVAEEEAILKAELQTVRLYFEGVQIRN